MRGCASIDSLWTVCPPTTPTFMLLLLCLLIVVVAQLYAQLVLYVHLL
jgi:hypothetical protein